MGQKNLKNKRGKTRLDDRDANEMSRQSKRNIRVFARNKSFEINWL